ncbi:MAG: hypothetical protein ACREQ3_24995 [Candidatus Binatia bacterium]
MQDKLITHAFIGFYWSHVGYVAFALALLALVCLLALKRWGVFQGQPMVIRGLIVMLIGLMFAGLAVMIERMTGGSETSEASPRYHAR